MGLVSTIVMTIINRPKYFTHQDECPSPLHSICTWHPGHSAVPEEKKSVLLILLPKIKGVKIWKLRRHSYKIPQILQMTWTILKKHNIFSVLDKTKENSKYSRVNPPLLLPVKQKKDKIEVLKKSELFLIECQLCVTYKCLLTQPCIKNYLKYLQ